MQSKTKSPDCKIWVLIIRGVKSYLQIRPSPGASLCTCAAEIIPGHPGCPLRLPPDTDTNTHTHPSTIYVYRLFLCTCATKTDTHPSAIYIYRLSLCTWAAEIIPGHPGCPLRLTPSPPRHWQERGQQTKHSAQHPRVNITYASISVQQLISLSISLQCFMSLLKATLCWDNWDSSPLSSNTELLISTVFASPGAHCFLSPVRAALTHLRWIARRVIASDLCSCR